MTTTIDNEQKTLNVPNLRFPEFEGEWQEERLSDIADISKGIGISKDQLSADGEPCILYGELYTKYKSETIKEVISKTNIDNTKLVKSKANDVIIPCSGETAEEIATARCVLKDDVLLGGDLNIIRLHGYDGSFMSYQLNGKRKYDIAKVAQGVSVVHLYGEHLKNIKTINPSLNEQKKIANLLSLLDERISTQNKIIDKLESLIKGIMVELQKQGQNKGNWRNVLLSKVLKERDERNTNLYQVFSVSVSQGVINQVDYLGRSYAARDTSKYNVVHYGDLVYTKSPTGAYPYGIVKQNFNQENVAVSPLYGVYIPNSLSVGRYLHEYFRSEINTHNYLHPLIQKGAKNTINITNQRFLENSVPIPVCANELLLISKLLLSFNDKIKYQQSILQQYQKQKQYLLRQMFI
ncbi:restriction endonuclease subunit S [Prevotella melaninogenica]|uniref:restriction endonuclease subunit S n=1 Tax=Prevotella melaninogenica TaxID=28132 RepID=UPI0001AE9F6E|nr:restriction endonuclease subunit S [Prevotella melaninogenica]ADK96747.1 type I restriction modification DNA specificity domain protein [Prevotella melaninogenica ATCC 25845]ASE18217.1 restriction endonuclease subunit S [Prevotella melaninogenica]UEB09273.1 restriction endonuclease subunit S [Prevotella melaninogenica]